MSFLESLFGNSSNRVLSENKSFVQEVNVLEKTIADKSDQEIQDLFLNLKKEIQDPSDFDSVAPRCFAYVREASKRTLGQRHFDEQLIGGAVLHQGKIAEMKTGEGKTLVATLSASLNALLGKGVHIVTVNDYLARRDAQWMGRIYDFLGLSVGVIQHDAAFIYSKVKVSDQEDIANLKPVSRKEAYASDITYGTNNEFGFDYLRDNMAPTKEHMVQRDLFFAIIDEVDSILIDEARTPLIISAPSQASSDQYKVFARHVERLHEGEDYNVDEKMRAVTLTEEGIKKMEQALGVENIYTAGGMETVHHVEQALRAKALFKRDKDYVVREGEVVIVDEFTGRLMFGRRYSEGLHQAIEAREGVNIREESQTLATITFQNYFRLYKKLSGMTGTAATESEEFAKIYNLDVAIIPTHKPVIRKDGTDRIYKTEKGKFTAVVREIKLLNEKQQPVLVGTISIEKNEVLSALLTKEGIPHEVLNAKNHAREAKIILDAGKKGAVTIATNMAGRGVDIVLGGVNADTKARKEVLELGGLHVIGTERHESRRIDNQLRGRSGRQGDPGSSQFFVSMEDDLLRIFGSDRMKSMMDRLGVPDDMPIENRMISRSIEGAQKKVEGHNFDIRKHLVEFDDVINKHRETIYKRRRTALDSSKKSDGIRDLILGMIFEEIEKVIQFHTTSEIEREWDVNEIYEVLDTIFPVDIKTRLNLEDIIKDIKGDAPHHHGARDALIQYCKKLATDAYQQFETRFDAITTVRTIERALYVRAIDSLWIEHLSLMDYLRQGIGLRGYGQRDPLVEYKKEAFKLFNELLENIRHQVVYSILKVSAAPQHDTNRPVMYTAPEKNATSSQSIFERMGSSGQDKPVQQLSGGASNDSAKTPQGDKIGRNDPCWCGSGKKFKKCHGA